MADLQETGKVLGKEVADLSKEFPFAFIGAGDCVSRAATANWRRFVETTANRSG